jgi:hypothetical protein
MEFGIIKKTPSRKISKEKYDFPVITLKAAPDTPKSKYFVQFNKAAATVLNVIDGGMVGFGIEESEVFISSITEGGYEVYKASLSITNKPLHLLLCEMLGLDEAIDNELQLNNTGDSFEGKNVYQLVKLLMTEEVEEVDDVPEDIHYEPKHCVGAMSEELIGSIESEKQEDQNTVSPFQPTWED